MTQPPCPPYQDIATLTRNLCISERTVDVWVKKGCLPPPRQFGDVRLWKWAEVQRLFGCTRRRKLVSTDTVYVLECAGFIKIGFSSSPKVRIKNLSGQGPLQVAVICTFPGSKILEGQLHERFATHRVRGEWFSREGELASWIDAGCPL